VRPTRRRLLWLAAAGLGCSSSRPEAKLVRSRIPLPKPFSVSLPIPKILAGSDSYEAPVRSAAVNILPGVTTNIWGYDGTFPGPIIEAKKDTPVRLRLRNDLPVPIVNHLHGGRTPPASDGYPADLVQPGEIREYVYPNAQRAATLWYHDHRMDYTAPQVWRGLAGMYILRDDAEASLPLPRGDKEIPLMICDRSFDSDGSFLYPSNRHEFMGGVLGDVILVNGAPWPTLRVANTKYRFRILNASNARRYELALDHPFVQIGSDGGLLSAPVRLRTIRIAPSERFDVIVDFSRYPLGSAVSMMDNGEPIMQFQVTRRERDESSIPARLSEIPPPNLSESLPLRVFDFAYQRLTGTWTINGKPFDINRMDARPRLGSTEIWQLQTDFSHPLHLHLVHFQILSHSGRPSVFDSGYKDTIDLNAGQVARILIRFDGYRGRYVFHCHILEHEDMAMMANFEVI
jgi:spore coat protein A, manganese oxidase